MSGFVRVESDPSGFVVDVSDGSMGIYVTIDVFDFVSGADWRRFDEFERFGFFDEDFDVEIGDRLGRVDVYDELVVLFSFEEFFVC